VADPPARQAALFKALKSYTVKSEYKQLARQVVREAMLQLDAAVKGKTRTRRELDWLLVLRDQALTSLGLIVSEVQEIAAKDDLAGAGAHISKGPETNDDHQVMAMWGPPAWAWVVPSDLKKPVSPVMDGWYLVSGDPGPKLRLMGPLKNRSMAIKGIQEFKTMDMKLFNTCLIRDSTVVEKFVYDASGSKIEGEFSGATKPDGWYVMINESEKLLWTLGLEVQQLERELAMCKKDAIQVRKTLRDLQSRMKARQEYLDKVAKSKKTLSMQQDEVAQELVEEIQDTITEEDLAQAQAADDETMGTWKQRLLKKRNLEEQMQAAEAAVSRGTSAMLTVEGPMALEVMAHQYILNKKSRRVRQALRVVHVEDHVMTTITQSVFPKEKRCA
jgi:hypothetical protein